MKAKILILTTSEGHRSIAEAIQQLLQTNQYEPVFCFIEEPGLAAYSYIYKHHPQLFRFLYSISNWPLVMAILNVNLRMNHDKELLKLFELHQPEIVINTSFGFTPSITKLKKSFSAKGQTGNFKFINIIPNPRTFFKQDVAIAADLNCVFDETIARAVSKDFPKEKILKTGWFTRHQFYERRDKNVLLKELNLKEYPITVLCVAGSEGTEAVFDTVVALAHLSTLQLVVACGHNASLVERVQKVAETAQAHIVAIPFTTQIAEYMQVADLVVGKAGPNMVFEAIASGKPFFATTHVTGLEDGNIDLIREYDIGFVEESAEIANKELIRIISQPEIIAQKMPQVVKIAEYIQKQSAELVKYLEGKNNVEELSS